MRLLTLGGLAGDGIAAHGFVAAARALDRFDGRRRFAPWLHRIVVNRAIDWTRARDVRREVPDDAESAASPPRVDAATAPDEEILRALAALPVEQRAVIVMRHLLDLTPGEIARALRLPRGTVNSRLRRGLDELILFRKENFFSLLKDIRRRRYDWVIDFLNTPRSAQIALASGAPVRAGFDVPFWGMVYNRKSPRSPAPHQRREVVTHESGPRPLQKNGCRSPMPQPNTAHQRGEVVRHDRAAAVVPHRGGAVLGGRRKHGACAGCRELGG